MNKLHFIISFFTAVIVGSTLPMEGISKCSEFGVDLQILGSGGPFGADMRASAGYLVWLDGRSRVMVDAGGGTFLRFHQADAKVADLDAMAISHFHPDHSSDIPALFWTQSGNATIIGPSGSDGMPSIQEFMRSMFETDSGAFRVVTNGRIEFNIIEVDSTSDSPVEVIENDDLIIKAIGVPHGPFPTIGYRIDLRERSIAFASDQIGTNQAFTNLIRDVDVLVAHFAASEEADGGTAFIHAKPSVWGQLAKDANVGHLVLSHLSQTEESSTRYLAHSGSDLVGNVARVREIYKGKITIAQDLMCIPL